jgi:hypothetical protein
MFANTSGAELLRLGVPRAEYFSVHPDKAVALVRLKRRRGFHIDGRTLRATVIRQRQATEHGLSTGLCLSSDIKHHAATYEVAEFSK